MKTIKTTVKTIFTTSKYALLALLITFNFACSPEDGEDGAQGPQGEQGLAGQDGNANVISSEWITATYVLDFSQRRSFIITTPELTQEALDNSAILFYGKTSSNEIWPVPNNFPFLNENYSYILSVGNAMMLCDSIDGTDISTNPYLQSFRYVIIPSNNTGKMQADFSKMSYQEVMDYFNLDY